MKIISYSALFLLVTFLGGCATQGNLQKTSLELQAFQSKEFEANKNIAFAAVFSVLQDFGYIIESASVETGFISAQSPTNTGIKKDWLLHSENTRVTAFIEELKPGFSKIRLNFVKKDLKSVFKIESSIFISDPLVYQNAFIKIEEAIFIRNPMK